LVHNGFAAPAINIATAQALRDSELALQSIEEQSRQRRIDEAARRDAGRPDFEDHGFFPHFPTLSPEERAAREDPNNPAYAPKEPTGTKGGIVEYPGRPEKKFEAPEPQQAPSAQE
jgi:hypothetical protein